MTFTLQAEDLQSLTAEAIEYLREHEPPEGYYVGFSGGKDSIVTLDLVRRSGVRHQAFYNDTLIDPPELSRFIRAHYPDVVRLRPDMTFWQGIIDRQIMPTRNKRWCCDVLKKGTTASKTIPLPHRVMGIRAEESARRASRPRTDATSKPKGFLYKPIFRWHEGHIWDYIEERQLAYPALYDEGFSRIGCVVCPFVGSPAKLAIHRARWPKHYHMLDITMRKLWNIKSGVFQEMGFTFEEFMAWPTWPSKLEREYEAAQYKMDFPPHE